jgi:hypothetical protein
MTFHAFVVRRLAARYWVIALTVIVAVIGGVIAIFGHAPVARWLIGEYTLLVACGYLVRMIRELLAGRFGIDILAVTAIASTVLRPTSGFTAVAFIGGMSRAARGVAAELGIERFRAECLPVDKVEHVAGIAQRPVIMCGDGVNDAPVLARADVGIAMGANGATAASESADVVLLVDELAPVATVVEIGRDTVRIALQSIWAGITASIALMIVAMFGVIPATAGALIQEGVDLITILAALRAVRARPMAHPAR